MKTVLAFLITLGLTSVLPAENAPESLRFFDPSKGFKSAQSNLTEAFLQAAASLEHFGSPEPYLRHMLAEHERIHKKAVAKFGDGTATTLPDSLTAERIEKLLANWNKLSPVLGLDSFARDVGQDVRLGIRGVWDKGTIAVTFLNEHQQKVIVDISNQGPHSVGFQQLKDQAVKELELDKAVLHLEDYQVQRRDAVMNADLVNAKFIGLQKTLRKKLPTEKADQITEAIKGTFLDMAMMVHSELEAGIVEWSLK
jgi:hypothetical protein